MPQIAMQQYFCIYDVTLVTFISLFAGEGCTLLYRVFHDFRA